MMAVAMKGSGLNDELLMERVAQGDQKALEGLYDRYGRLVYGLARNIVGDEPTAEEITQDVFTRVWQKSSTYRAEQGRPLTWLMRITRNRAIDELRRRGTRPRLEPLPWTGGSALSDGEDPAEAADLAQRRRSVAAAMSELPQEQRRVLALAYFRAYTHQQIADSLGQPLGTVKTRLRLAMQKMRRLVELKEGRQ